jgi:hypothetical protein
MPARPPRFTVEVGTNGRVYYTVDRVGVFTLEPNPYQDDGSILVSHGRGSAYLTSSYKNLPEAPVIYGITLLGGSVYNPDRDKANPWARITVRRLTDRYTGQSVPDATRRRTEAIIEVLAGDWLQRPDLPLLKAAAQCQLLPARIREHQHVQQKLLAQRDELDAKITEEHDQIEALHSQLRDAQRLTGQDLSLNRPPAGERGAEARSA